MDARGLMREEYFGVHPQATVLDAGRLMLRHGLHALPVVAEDRQLIGVLPITAILALALPSYLDAIADFSFLTAAVEWSAEEVPDLSALTVEALLSRPLPRSSRSASEQGTYEVVREDEPLVEVARLLVREGALLCAVAREGRLVGVIGRHDLLRVIIAPWEGTP